jgi:hypothetical protein
MEQQEGHQAGAGAGAKAQYRSTAEVPRSRGPQERYRCLRLLYSLDGKGKECNAHGG